MIKHTPGPWFITDSMSQYVSARVNGGRLQTIAESEPIVAGGGYGEEQRANANLIAAAPDLLEALEWICARQDWTGDNYPDLQWWDRAQKAIAKARGES